MAVSDMQKKLRPFDEQMIVVKIYSPLSAIYAGDYKKLQDDIDKKLCDNYLNQFNVVLYGYTNESMYIYYANNSNGPGADLDQTILVEYYCTGPWEDPDTMAALKLIHQTIIGPKNLITVKYMIFNNIKMTGLDPSPFINSGLQD